MRVLSVIAVSLLVAYYGQAATAKRDWKVGTLMETAHAREPEPQSIVVNNNLGPHAPFIPQRIPRTWQAFRIEGNGYRYNVMCQVRPNHSPNVTVNGPLKYAMEKGKFYLLDEDDKEWEMTVLEKALILPPGGEKVER